MCSGDKLLDSLVNLVEQGVVQIQNVHTALSNGVVFLANENPAAIEEYGELVVRVGVLKFGVFLFLCHICRPLCIR